MAWLQTAKSKLKAGANKRADYGERTVEAVNRYPRQPSPLQLERQAARLAAQERRARKGSPAKGNSR